MTTRNLTTAPFGVNLFVLEETASTRPPSTPTASRSPARLTRLGATLGETRFDDDDLEAKVTVLEQARVAVVSTAFGCPSAKLTERLHAAGSAVWVTIGSPEEVEAAVAVAADALVVQGTEAGGHRGGLDDAASSACSRCSGSSRARPTCRSLPPAESPTALRLPLSSRPGRPLRRSARRSCAHPKRGRAPLIAPPSQAAAPPRSPARSPGDAHAES